MNLKRGQIAIFMACSAVGVSQFGACTTSILKPSLPVNPPSYTQVPHPQGGDLGDINALFQERGAPRNPNFAKVCGADFTSLKRSALSKSEIDAGIDELVMHDPVHYHWCFYARMAKLEEEIKADTYVDERQRKLLQEYEFFVPVARVFKNNFNDSRYLRWAIARYRKLSEWIFSRKLDLTPQGTAEFVRPEVTFGLWRSPVEQRSIMEKYHLGDPYTGMWVDPNRLFSNRWTTSPVPSDLPTLTVDMPEDLSLMPLPEGELIEGLLPPPEDPEGEPLPTPSLRPLLTPSPVPSPTLSPTSSAVPSADASPLPLGVPSSGPSPVVSPGVLPSPAAIDPSSKPTVPVPQALPASSPSSQAAPPTAP